jgi:hypothetical protein
LPIGDAVKVHTVNELDRFGFKGIDYEHHGLPVNIIAKRWLAPDMFALVCVLTLAFFDFPG